MRSKVIVGIIGVVAVTVGAFSFVAEALPTVTICEVSPTGEAEMQVEVYDSGTDWARTQCIYGACPGGDCTETKPDGLTYLSFVTEEVGGTLRYNDNNPEAVAVVHGGGGGLLWKDEPRDASGTTDWADLQNNHDLRVVAVRWFDTGVDYGTFDQGRYVHTDATTQRGFALNGQRTAAVIDWIQENLNKVDGDLLLVGSSGGSEAMFGPVLFQSDSFDNIKYLSVISTAPFYDLINTCNSSAPTNIDIDTGVPLDGEAGGGSLTASERQFFDDYLRSTKCVNQNMDGLTSADSNIRDYLDDLYSQGLQYTGVVHGYPADGSGATPDTDNGITWTIGNIYNHPYFDSATRVWDYCPNQAHATQITTNTACFDPIYDELKAILDVNPPPPTECNDGIDNDGDGNIDLTDTGCVDANDDDENLGACRVVSNQLCQDNHTPETCVHPFQEVEYFEGLTCAEL